MTIELGQNQSVTQAVVVPEEIFDHNTAPMMVALFKPDGTPFLADTATVYSVATAIWNPLGDDLWTLFMETASPAPYPFRSAVFNQLVSSRNGIYQNMTGAPGTTGNQIPKKVAELPTTESVILTQHLFIGADGEVLGVGATPITGGFILTSTEILVDGVADFVTRIFYRGDVVAQQAVDIQMLSDRLDSAEGRLTTLENP